MSKYIVNARIPEGADQDTLVANFARAFNVSEVKARGRLSKLPGRVSKPVTNREARYLAKRFDKIGLLTDIIETPAHGAASTPTTEEDATKDTAERESEQEIAHMLRDTQDSGESQRPAKVDREAATQAFAASFAAMADTPPTSTEATTSPLNTFEDPAFSLQSAAINTADTASTADTANMAGAATNTGVSPATKRKTRLARMHVRFGVRKKLLLAALAPALMVLLISVLTVTMQLPPLLQNQQEITSEAIATTLATSIAALIVNPLENPSSQDLLQQWLARTQTPLAAQNIDALLVSDMRGQILAGWLGDSSDFSSDLSSVPLTLQATLQAEVARASARFAAEQSGVVLGQRALPAPMIRVGQRDIVLTARAITQNQNGSPSLLGAVIVGSDVQPNQRTVRNLLLLLALLALLPLLIGAVLALWLGSRIRQVVRGILARGDKRYAKDATRADSHDEVGLLARTLHPEQLVSENRVSEHRVSKQVRP